MMYFRIICYTYEAKPTSSHIISMNAVLSRFLPRFRFRFLTAGTRNRGLGSRTGDNPGRDDKGERWVVILDAMTKGKKGEGGSRPHLWTVP